MDSNDSGHLTAFANVPSAPRLNPSQAFPRDVVFVAKYSAVCSPSSPKALPIQPSAQMHLALLNHPSHYTTAMTPTHPSSVSTSCQPPLPQTPEFHESTSSSARSRPRPLVRQFIAVPRPARRVAKRTSFPSPSALRSLFQNSSGICI